MCKFVTIFLLIILAFFLSPIAFALDSQLPFDFPISSCCDGGDCCILNDCSCPNCEERGEPGGECERCGSDLCENCGNCYTCGTSPCPVCIVYNVNNDEVPPASGTGDTGNTDDADNSDNTANTGAQMHIADRAGNASWTITNLILPTLGIVLTIVASVYAIREKRNHNTVYDNDYMRRFRALTITMFILCALSVALFFFTQTITRHFVLFDYYTIAHAILFLAIAFLIARINTRIENQKYVITQTAWEV